MRVLVLAPHPFYQERGTPIAVDLLLRALSERGDSVDLLTFHEGADRQYERLRIYRIKPIFPVSGIRPGLSWKKIVCDIHLFFRFTALIRRSRYNVVHAIEEAALMVCLLRPFFSIPFVYDMDSSMTAQIIDKHPVLRFAERPLRLAEAWPVRSAEAVVPMCDALAEEARKCGARRVVILRDISLVPQGGSSNRSKAIRGELGIKGKIVMYIGNLETYQGIDLLLDSFKVVRQASTDVYLVIIGGVDSDIAKYRRKAASLGIGDYVYFLGKRPVAQIGEYMKQADILVSPRTRGVNTPMKIYSYLDSGRPVLATDLPTHTQVMTPEMAMLAKPNKESFAAAIAALLNDPELCERLASRAKEYIAREHSYSSFKDKLHGLYADLEQQVAKN